MDIAKNRYGNVTLSIEETVTADDLYDIYLQAGGVDYKDRCDELRNELDREMERSDGLETQLRDANAMIKEIQDTVARLERAVDERNALIETLQSREG